ncbi:hypothetical protein Glove_426g102 [Diversispora epigaea]|uniref:Uncharacterized protein n=1 Tax=Diversispora epigaea TaxID=1348612 RepID=A0A397H2C4_9GLOM|nr:hypothetical protein Glove_426g102 [Diversispora epigaea]
MNKDGWKYSKKKLSKHEFYYLNRHANGNGCKRKIGQQTILCFFNTTNFDESEDISSEEEYNSDICDNMDDNDIITVDSNDNNNNDLDNILSSEDENIQLTIKNTRKRIPCPGLQSQKIRYYIERTPAQVGGTRPEWKIDREGYCVCAKNCNGEYINNNLCIECKQLKSNTKLDNRLNGAFDNVDTFKGLCAVICQVINRKEEGKEMRNLQYSEEFINFLIVLGTVSPRALELFRQNLVGRSIQNIRKLRANSSDTLTNPDLCFENVARFKRFLDKINYKGPIAAMSDNTKLKPSLRYSSRLGCIIDKKAIANYVRVYILQIPLPKFPPVIIALIPNNGKDSADNIANIHKKLILEIAPQLNISILSIGSDGAAAEFGAQSIILNTKTDKKVEIIDKTLNINFNCPVFSNIGPVLRIQDPKHVKKTARNVVMSGARVLTFGKHIACFEHFLKLVNLPNSVLYNGDVIKLDRQDDGAAYRSFCHQNLAQCLNGKEIKEGYEGKLVDSYLNREICPIERMRMCYIFDYNKGNLTEDIISNLTRWPSDSEISRAIRQSRQLACELAEHLNMLMPDNLPIENLQPIVIIEMDNDPEISVSFFEDSNEEEFELNEINSFSQTISKASNEISSRQIVNYIENDDDINNINEYCAQINLLNQNIVISITNVVLLYNHFSFIINRPINYFYNY